MAWLGLSPSFRERVGQVRLRQCQRPQPGTVAEEASVAAMPDEEVQELGREGVGMVKAWLESTTWMRLSMNAYQDGARCSVAYAGGRKKFDLRGELLGNKSQRAKVWVECKRYSGEGAQHREFRRFLAIAYAYTKKQIEELGDCNDEFLWVTSHPFFVSGWSDLIGENKLREAVEDSLHKDVTDGIYDPSIGQELSQRIWLLVWSEKQVQRLTLSQAELAAAMGVISREGDPLWSR